MAEKKIKIISERVKTEFEEVKKEQPDIEESLEEVVEEETGEGTETTEENFTEFVSEERTPILQPTASAGMTTAETEPLETGLENVPSAATTPQKLYDTEYFEGEYSRRNYTPERETGLIIPPESIGRERFERKEAEAPVLRSAKSAWTSETAQVPTEAEIREKYKGIEEKAGAERKISAEKRRRIRA